MGEQVTKARTRIPLRGNPPELKHCVEYVQETDKM